MVGVNNPGNQQAEGQSSAEGSVTSLVDNKVTLLYFHGKIFTNFTPFCPHKHYYMRFGMFAAGYHWESYSWSLSVA